MALSPEEEANLVSDVETHKGWLTEISTSLALVERTASKVPALRGEVEQLRTQITEAIRTNAVQPGSVGTTKISSLEEKVNKVLGDFEVLKDQVKGHEGRLGAHDDLFAKLDDANKERDGRVAIIGTSVAQAHARIDVLDQDRGFNPIVLILALVAAIGGGVFMAQFDWVDVVKNADGTTTTTGNPGLDSWFGIGLGALVAFAVVIMFGYLFAAFVRDDETTTTSVTGATAQSRVTVARDSGEPPTAVNPVIPPPPPPPARRSDAGQPVG